MAKGSLRVNGIIVDTDGEIKASTGDSIVIREDDGSAVITVDTNGKTSIGGPMDVGVDDTGHDVKFFGATAGAYLEWDESADELEIRGGAATAGKLLLSTAETTVVDGNKLGQIDFQAPLDSAGTDAILVGASIHAEADATFSSSVNATELVFSTGASETAAEKMRITSDGKVGIGTTAPSTELHVYDGTAVATLTVGGSGTGYTNAELVLEALTGTNERGTGVFMHDAGGDIEWFMGRRYDSTDNFQIGRQASLTSHNSSVSQAANALLTIDNAGKVGIGTTAPGTQLHLVEEGANLELKLQTFSDTEAQTNFISFFKADGTAGSPGLVDDDCILGGLTFYGYDGSNYHEGALIKAQINGTPSDGTDMPTELVFSTTADGAGSPTQRMVISPAGSVGIGTTAPHSDFKFTVADSSGTGESTYLKFTNATSGHATGDGFYMGIDGSANAHLWNQETTTFNIATNNVRRFQIDGNGKTYIDSGYNYGWLRSYDQFTMANGATFNHNNTNSTLYYIYLNSSGQGALYWGTYTSTIGSIQSSGSLLNNANTGTSLRVYKSGDNHTTTFSNQSGGDLAVTMIVVAASG